MKIWVGNRFHPRDLLGGAELQSLQIAEGLLARGHEVTFFALEGKAEGREDPGLPVIQLGSKLSLGTFSRLAVAIRRAKPDLIYFRSFEQLQWVAWAASRSNTPVVYNTCHVRDLSPSLPRVPARNAKQFLKGSWKRATQKLHHRAMLRMPVVTVSREHTERLETLYGKRSETIYNGMRDRHGAGFPEKQNRMVWVANIKQRKQPERYLELVKALADTGWSFSMVGAIQTQKSHYQEMLEAFGKQVPAFRYHGPLPPHEVDALLARSKLQVTTCLPEGFSNNLIQGWLAGVPSLALAFDPDSIMASEGIGIHAGSMERLISESRRLIQEDAARSAMGRKARAWALAHHDIDKNVAQYEGFFERVLEQVGA